MTETEDAQAMDDQLYWYAFQVYRFSWELCHSPQRTAVLAGDPQRKDISRRMRSFGGDLPDVLVDWYEEQVEKGTIQFSKAEPLTPTPVP